MVTIEVTSYMALSAMASSTCLRIITLVTCCLYVNQALIIRHDKAINARAKDELTSAQTTPTYTSRHLIGGTKDDFPRSVESLEFVGFQNDAVSESSSTRKLNGHQHRLQHQPQQGDLMGRKAVKPSMNDQPHPHQQHHHPHRHKDSSDPKQSTTHVQDHVTSSRSRMTLGLNKGLSEIKKANEHYLKVHNHARCKVPKWRVVKVKDYYPDPSKEYLPSCTLLHRCGEDAGCCESETMQCVAKKRDLVELHFYKLNLGNMGDGVGITRGDTVEKLTFYNDTECECQPMDDRPRFHYRKTGCLQCPSEFSLREISKDMGGGCSCDCFDRQKSCLKIKRGREPLPELDRRCVDARRCHPPECEYGVYDQTLGRCPKKHEKRNHGSNSNTYDHWWRFDGRE